MKDLLHLVYPPLCIHCKEVVLEHQKILCLECLSLLTLLNAEERCSMCFAESHLKICIQCQKREVSYSKFALCFDHFGPAASLLNEFKKRLYLDRHLASWMVVQMDKMGFSFPNLIFPFPQTFSDKILNGYNRAALLADEIGRFYEVPVKKKNLSCTQEHYFYWKNTMNISDQAILLVVEKKPSIELLNQCAGLIQTGFPKSVSIIACV